jgi:hypothetical protein
MASAAPSHFQGKLQLSGGGSCWETQYARRACKVSSPIEELLVIVVGNAKV